MKTRLYFIVLLLIIWCGFSNNFYIENIILGLFFATAIHFLIMPNRLKLKINLFHLIVLCFYIAWELVCSSLEVAWDILTPAHRSKPEIIKLPLTCHHPVQISLLANLISLTPGTLAIDMEENKNILIIHVMFVQNHQKIITFIKNNLEPKIIKAINYA